MEQNNQDRKQYLKIIRNMSPEERLKKCFELNELTSQLFLAGLKKWFPNLSEEEIKKIYLRRIDPISYPDI